MSATKQDAKWPFIVNLSNSIIGVSVLAMPFCFQECGILLGALLLAGSNIVTRLTSHLLLKGSHLTRRRSYELYAHHVMGPPGKVLVEVLLTLFLLSTLCAFFVVIGDLGPHIIADIVGLKVVSGQLRAFLMILIAIWIILPLSLLRNMESLNNISSMAILFYGVFVVRLTIAAVPTLLDGGWISEVNWWQPRGVLQCLPIFALSLSCQTQLFVTAESMLEPSPAKMDSVVAGAVNLCSLVYLLVGFFGYITFHNTPMGGDVLILLDASFLTELIKLCFMLSVAVSFPLMLFPCRAAIYTFLFNSTPPATSDMTIDVMPETSFRIITVSVIFANLCIGIVIPNVEFVLGLTGASIGSFICVVLPCALFLYTAPEHQFYSRLSAQVCFCAGMFMMIVCTFATLRGVEVHQDPPVEIPPAVTEFRNISAREVVQQAPEVKGVENFKIEPKVLDQPPPNLPIANLSGRQRKEPPIPQEQNQIAPAQGAPINENNAENPELKARNENPDVGIKLEQPVKENLLVKPTPPKDGVAEVKEAAKLVKELKEQKKEQQALLEEQKKLIRELKDQKEEKKFDNEEIHENRQKQPPVQPQEELRKITKQTSRSNSTSTGRMERARSRDSTTPATRNETTRGYDSKGRKERSTSPATRYT